jgi:hypothetical protein
MPGSKTPGSWGIISCSNTINDGTSALIPSPLTGPVDITEKSCASETNSLSAEEHLLAAVIFGESSGANVFEEMAGIGAVLVKQAKARGYNTVLSFLESSEAKKFTLVLVDGNTRFKQMKEAKIVDINNMPGFALAVKAARHAISKLNDFSGGGYFWDGEDLRANYVNHPKVLRGMKFTDQKHDIYNVGEKSVEKIEYWYIKDPKGVAQKGKERGRYKYTYESTAAYGGTVFWRYASEYLKATGNKEYK